MNVGDKNTNGEGDNVDGGVLGDADGVGLEMFSVGNELLTFR